MDVIFHEKQEGSLCAQHCLNALLQGPYFSPVELADIARDLDETERQQMAEGGEHTEGYQQFIKQPSNNFDDSGFFSVQVIDKALRVWGLELLAYNSQNEMSVKARQCPTSLKAYICNFGEHWLTVRKLGNQWFNLNSLLTGPELISDTYLGMFLTQLQQDGYSIFIVLGDLMETEADQVLNLCPVTQPIKPKLISDGSQSRGSRQQGEGLQEDDEDIGQALRESKQLAEADDVSLQKVLQMSMEGFIEESVHRIESACHLPVESTGVTQESLASGSGAGTPSITASPSQTQEPVASGSGAGSLACNAQSGQTQRQLATGSGQKLSESSTQSSAGSPSVDEMRQRRLAYLEKQAQASSSKTTDQPKTESVINNTKTAASGELSEEEMLKQAIAMSMSQDT